MGIRAVSSLLSLTRYFRAAHAHTELRTSYIRSRDLRRAGSAAAVAFSCVWFESSKVLQVADNMVRQHSIGSQMCALIVRVMSEAGIFIKYCMGFVIHVSIVNLCSYTLSKSCTVVS